MALRLPQAVEDCRKLFVRMVPVVEGFPRELLHKPFHSHGDRAVARMTTAGADRRTGTQCERRWRMQARESSVGRNLPAGSAAALLLASLALAASSTEHCESVEVGDRFRDCDECPEMVVIPSGRFKQGAPGRESGGGAAEGPVGEVQIERFSLGRTELTRGEYRRFIDATGYRTDAERSAGGHKGSYAFRASSEIGWQVGASWRDPGFAQDDSHPVVCISWNDAKAYVDWLRQRTGEAYRFPTESELEYANRAGTTTPWPWGADGDGGYHMANYADTTLREQMGRTTASCRDGHVFTAPAGSLRTNAWGLHDTAGNAWEWAEDVWNMNYHGAPVDGRVWKTGDPERRVLRGGAWLYQPDVLRAVVRIGGETDFRSHVTGFRVARD